jgi:hypothetical protein
MSNSSDWKSINEEWEEKVINSAVFKRQKNIETIPLDCPVCKLMLVTVEDINSYREVSACDNCKLVHYYPNKEKWEEGWRPFSK